GFKELIRHVRFVSHGWLPHSAATSHTQAYRFEAPQGFAAPGSRPPLTRQTTHSKFKRGLNLLPEYSVCPKSVSLTCVPTGHPAG
ncbi:hypothetical protein P3T43_006724, partial [Paraburkholderia sp. GAS41]|uniref:hypothetical protein n=1 Tax=Paraburkholderia sp. GAS41 TaxID=3035134 RepID=UPI003D24B351